ncbi:MAG: hypothetical protein Q7S55_00670 [Nanoarchaeota archaeon]|nr:hypothetical protein [Nanoarchaeota archaeon]
MVLENLANGILGLVNWGITIIVFMFLWECYKFITNGTEGGKEVAGKVGKKIWKYVPGTTARAKRVTKKEMNEYIMEEREEQKLDEVKNALSTLVADFEVLSPLRKRSTPPEAQKFLKLFGKLEDKIKDAKKYFRGLNRRTSRAQTGINRLFEYMKDKGVKDDQLVQKVKVMEDMILKLHQQTAEEVSKVEAEYGSLNDSSIMKELRSFSEGSSASPMSPRKHESVMLYLKEMAELLEKAYGHQTKAKQQLQGVIALTRGLM